MKLLHEVRGYADVGNRIPMGCLRLAAVLGGHGSEPPRLPGRRFLIPVRDEQVEPGERPVPIRFR